MTDTLELTWGDGEHRFRLPIGQLRELQDKCSAGPQRILMRLSSMDWRIEDVREVIRLGLIGGGKTPSDAHMLVVRYVDERPLMESRLPAQAILMKALIGDPDDQPGELPAEKVETPTPTPMAE